LLGKTAERWTAEEVRALRDYLGWSDERFAERIGANERTVRRWRASGKGPAHRAINAALDQLLIEAVGEVASGLPAHKVRRMDRRNLLRLLATGALAPLDGIDLQPLSGPPPRVGPSMLDGLEATITALASTYTTSSSRLLLPAVLGELDDACVLLSGSMASDSRTRLLSIVADIGVFAGAASGVCGQVGRARAFLSLAEEQAREAGDMALLAQVLGQKSIRYATTPSGGLWGDPKRAAELVEQAVELADRYAPHIVRAWLHALAAEFQAAAGDFLKVDAHLERAERALQAAAVEGQVGSGFCSSTGHYATFNEHRLVSFRGTAEMLAGRPQAASTLTRALKHVKAPRPRVNALTDLGAARALRHPEEAAKLLGEAHNLSVEYDYTLGVRRVLGVRQRFDPRCGDLSAVCELDERLGLR